MERRGGQRRRELGGKKCAEQRRSSYRPGNIFVWPIYFKSETSASLTFFSHCEPSSCCTHVLVFACKSLTAALSLLTGLINQTVLPRLLDKSLFVHPSQAKSTVSTLRTIEKRTFLRLSFYFRTFGLDTPTILSVTFLNGEQFLLASWIIKNYDPFSCILNL